ncbi:pyruvate dehydrogenase (acetyl-transferring) E1 component subunit alpha [Candidatus Marsarchaeota G1 archaeon OSP_D]|jgi:pyruvate dehydrogenase E1 component alpha subunit|uniref:Pyruvate dehydrogenase (Acetyl-transferring) E1 component subunit alpha n=3 Tax=Candidatus Marsarchaeota group 1 TaxID=2203770 RepID=A0A2R6A6K4_9ARCH|nr:MAG: pyruvate dehydrogenase (acetyl-transferring) E1 component subunit alpha [Candidatus Marsarchaeota G1 archaeon BE_D]PSN83535.1 MAG: pyruvate dehydrogenase (acetyl-transferring) E1 component subunit alpha [Candidatus Marsarchaeota G1 archaeon OSP_D]
MAILSIKSVQPEKYKDTGLSKKELLEMWRKMVLIRKFEEKVEELFLIKKLLKGPAHLYIGEEAVATGVISALTNDDVIVSHYRGHGHALARGVPPRYIMAELFGKATGTCKGVGGSMHSPKYPELNLMYATAIVGSGIPIATGMALAIKMKKENRVVTAFFGDGAVNSGAFHEGVNMAAIWKVPLLLVCENNQYAISMRADKATAGPGIANRAEAYGITGAVVDGNDVIAVYMAAKDLIQRIKNGEGPMLLECRTYRIKGHGVYDQAQYRPQEEVEFWKKRDPILLYKDWLIKSGVATEEELKEQERKVQEEVEEAVSFAEQSPMLSLNELSNFVYA